VTRALASLALALAVAAGGCGAAQAQEVGATYRGKASWYSARFHGRKTASGERYDRGKLTAAHRTLPFGSKVRVTALKTGKRVVVRINDRGPWGKGKIIDVSEAAARKLGMIRAGVIKVKVEVLELGAKNKKRKARRKRKGRR